MMHKKKYSKGFTLVELAIVLVIVGLLIAGILKGQEIIHNAQMQKTVSQSEGLIAAHHTFRQNYNRIPGDIADATSKLPNCDAAHNCANGDGNNVLGTPISNAVAASGGAENVQYWKHLAMANLITSVDITASTATADLRFGATHPETPLGGSGWNAVTTDSLAGDYGGRGVVFQITGIANISAIATTPHEAFYIDRTLDDGRPNSGKVTAEWSSFSSCDDDTNNEYNTDINSLECTIFFSTR